jgi:2-polyprenyl-3-methyl-5-hydroxy-6-metoxy-1,4-benzoquinol methylase
VRSLKSVAESWDLAYQVKDIPWHSEQPPRELIRVLREGWFKNRNTILDIGCGIGSSSIAMAKAGFDVTGVDISKTAIEEAKFRASELGLDVLKFQGKTTTTVIANPAFGRVKQSRHLKILSQFSTPHSANRIGRIRFKVQDVFHMKPLYGKFDIVTDIACLHCFDGKWRKPYLKEIHCTIKPNGLYWVMTFGRKAPDYGPYRYSQKELRELTSPLFKTLFIQNADWSSLYQRTPSEIQSVSCLLQKQS